MGRHFACGLLLVFISTTRVTLADGPADNSPDSVRRIPKPGIEVPEADRQELEAGLQKLGADLVELQKSTDARTVALIPDVEIFHRAVDQALRYGEFFDAKELVVARGLLKQGQDRATQLRAGSAPWTTQTGPVVRGYRSRIDATVQPFGLVIPATYDFTGSTKHRLDFWFHGRGETLSEVNFLNDRTRNAGAITPADTIVLHPYGRYCNANKFAGEIDSFEALATVEQHYRIDPDRIAVRGFSMGGAACWQFAVHYPDRWFAANPGAGFSETPEFLRVFQNEPQTPSAIERKLWRMYDCPGYAVNLSQLPTIAYSGEIDRQKQAADIMAAAFEREGMTLRHVIGPKTGHSIHPESKAEIEAQLADWAKSGRQIPSKLQFVTFTLRYPRLFWLTVNGLNEHWEEARVVAEPQAGTLVVTTRNVSSLTLDPPAGVPRRVQIDGTEVALGAGPGTWVRTPEGWRTGQLEGLRKKPGLQGPIDDALMDRFIFVTPGQAGHHAAVDAWVKAELEHAVTHWRRQMRGDAIVKRDRDITPEDIASSNLILWGDSASNAVLAKISEKLPIRWTAQTVQVGNQSYDAAQHGLVAVYPNPLNPERYVVLNSSFTYREYDYLNNARQVPKLPDWAVVDLRTPPGSRWPGKIVAADFFDERWQLKPASNP